LVSRAILTLAVGTALFFSSCLPKTPPDAPTRPSDQALFREAEESFLSGDGDRALKGYQRYLDEAPLGDKARIALSRMVSIHTKANRLHEALPLLERLVRDYPLHPETPLAHVEMAAALHRLGERRRASTVIEAWLERYPSHPLRNEALVLLGESKESLGERPAAWIAYTNAWRSHDQPLRKLELHEKIILLIETMDLSELQEIRGRSSGTAFEPHVLYRIASVHLKERRFLEAYGAATRLMQNFPHPPWADLGRQVLEKGSRDQGAARYLIGCLLPLSGPFAIYGEEVLNGIQLGAGFFSGPGEGDRGLELFVRDTRGDAELASSQVEEMASKERILAIIGPLTSKSATAAAKKAQELGVPLITLTQKEGITDEGNMVSRNFLTPAREISILVDKVAGQMGLTRFAILHPDNAYGRYLMNLFWDGIEGYGAAVTAVESYKPAQTDFTAQIKKMIGLYHPRPEPLQQYMKGMKYSSYDVGTELEPAPDEYQEPIVDFDAVFIPDSAEKVALISPQLPFHDVFNIRFLGSSLWQSRELTGLAGDYLQGAIFPSTFFSGNDSDQIKQFVESYRAAFGSYPGVLAANGYDTILLLKSLLKDGALKTRQDIHGALLTARGFHGVTGHIAFDENREVMKDPVLLTIRGRKILPVP
jgi:ABC-type branched-subunit amino acid transport system substrate-binding protein/TolA-binding protein